MHPTLMQDIERVLHNGATVETQTWDKRGRCYFLRVLPYRARKPVSADRRRSAPIDARTRGARRTIDARRTAWC